MATSWRISSRASKSSGVAGRIEGLLSQSHSMFDG